ncbi:MAG TPA: CoA transferase [Hyphomicrobiales bacterium]|nr:CoA transferase [Hyphomicrobiales bacterium]
MPARAPLGRFRVIDLTRVRSGPTAVRQLADWGADVIKVEAPGGDVFSSNRAGGDFQNLHRNKRSITLDLKQPDAKRIFMRMVEDADVVVENYRPDVKKRLGIDYPTLSALNPRLVYGSISGFGQDGPYAMRPGFDQVAQGMGGLMSITGLPGQGPVRAGTAIADLTAGLFCAMGILTALLEREESGHGQWVHTSLLEAQIFMLDFQAARWLVDGEVAGQAGNDHPTNYPTGLFETADGHLNIAASGQAMWERLCKVMDVEQLRDHPDYATDVGRSKNRAALAKELAAVTRTRPTADWVKALNEAGVPCGPVYRIDEMFGDPQVRHLGIAQSIDRDGREPITLVGQPVHLSRTPSKLETATPENGEHSQAILEELGFSAAEIAGFRDRGAV